MPMPFHSEIRKKLCLPIFLIAALLTTACNKSSEAITPDPPKIPDGVFHIENLKQWNAWKANPASRFDWVLLGDSYTQGDYYAEKLRLKVLGDGYQDGGAGYCSFNRWGSVAETKDSSIEPASFDFNYDASEWLFQNRNTIGPCGFVTSTTANADIHVTASKPLSSITIIYERHAAAGSFRYRVGSGSWVTVSDNNLTPDIASTIIDVSTAGSNIVLDIETLNPGIEFCGVLGKRNGNVLAMHKCGSSGAPAYMFATNNLWSQSTQLLTPKGVVIQFGINEMIGDVSPADMKASIQNIITKVRAFSPNCDIIIVSPPQTTYEAESPHKYKLAAYTTVLSQLAIDNAAAFVDLNIAFGPFSQASVDKGLIDQDRVHPGAKGGELIAATIYGALQK